MTMKPPVQAVCLVNPSPTNPLTANSVPPPATSAPTRYAAT